MTAKFSIMYEALQSGIDSDTAYFALIADETHFDYVVSKGVPSEHHFHMRAEALVETSKDKLSSVDEWLDLGTRNFNYIRFSDPVTTDSFEQAVSQAKRFLTEYDNGNTELEDTGESDE